LLSEGMGAFVRVNRRASFSRIFFCGLLRNP
jgi:hypothetical protein